MKNDFGPRTSFALLIVFALLSATLAGAAPVARVSVIVQGSSVGAAEAAVAANGGQTTARIGIINAVVAEVPLTLVARLGSMPGVVRVTPDRSVQMAGRKVVDVEFPEVVGAQEVWATGNLGAGVTVAMLDSGIIPGMQELRRTPSGEDRILAYYDALSGELYEPPRLGRSPKDPNGHGTHVAGIIANSFYEPQDDGYRGIAPAANLVVVRVLDEIGSGSYADVLEGIDWVVQNKDTYNIRVLNISMYATPVAPYWADPYNLAVMAAWQAGIVVVASAGNGGPAPLSIGVPGNTPYVITVGAFTDNYTPDDFGDDYMPPFSATGPTLDAFVKPDLIAPGAHMVSTMRNNSHLAQEYPENRVKGHYFRMAGTSMSAATVSGIVALMLSEHPELTPDQVKYRLAITARPQFSEYTGEAAYSIWEQGAGRVWAPDAVFTDAEGEANLGMDLAADLAGTIHYQGWTDYDPLTGEFVVKDQAYESWSGGYESWSGAYESWSGGYESWSGGTTNWSGDFNCWLDAYESWSGGYESWSGGYESWSGGYESWSGGYESWSGGYASWAGGYESWSGGYESWSGGYESWSGGVSDPDWAAAFVNLQNLPTDTSAVGINALVDSED